MLGALPPVSPGIYPGAGQASLLRANSQQFLFRQQLQPTGGVASIAVQLERIKSSYFYPFAVSFQIWFTDVNGVAANPGAIDIEVQTSDIDADAQFVNESGLTGGLNASFVGRVQLTLSWMKFVRVLATTVTNAVYLNVLVTR